ALPGQRDVDVERRAVEARDALGVARRRAEEDGALRLAGVAERGRWRGDRGRRAPGEDGARQRGESEDESCARHLRALLLPTPPATASTSSPTGPTPTGPSPATATASPSPTRRSPPARARTPAPRGARRSSSPTSRTTWASTPRGAPGRSRPSAPPSSVCCCL